MAIGGFAVFARNQYLVPLPGPAPERLGHAVVVYRAVGKYEESDLRAWMEAQVAERVLTVFVGASSRHRQSATTLVRAQQLWAQTRPDIRLGGVAIPERHTRRGEEHLRLIAKQEAGCSFFVTQVVYDVNAAKNLVSDYRYEGAARGLEPVPIVFTFSVFGSLKTYVVGVGSGADLVS